MGKKNSRKTEVDRMEVLERLASANLDVQMFYSSTKTQIFCKVGATDERLLLEADIAQYRLLLEPASVKKVAESDVDMKKYGRMPIFMDYPYSKDIDIHHNFKERNPRGEWVDMEQNKAGKFIKRVSTMGPFDNLYVRYNDTWERRIKDDHGVQIFKTQPDGTILRPADRMKLVLLALERSTAMDLEHGLPGAEVIAQDLIFKKKLTASYPLQMDTARQVAAEINPDQLFSEWNRLDKMPWNQPHDKIREYMGEKMAIYFAFLGHYTLWLTFPALVGCGIFLHQLYELHDKTGSFDVIGPGAAKVTLINVADPVSGNVTNVSFESKIFTKVPEAPGFAFFIALWASFMIEFWKRTQARLALRWGMSDYQKMAATRVEFQASHTVPCPVTGQPVEYYSKTTFLAKLMCSFTVIFTAITIVMAGIIGVVILKVVASRNNSFLPPNIAPQAALVVNSLMIILFGFVYKVIARKLNDWENHRTDIQYEDHLIAKTFVFSFINSYSALTYMAFIKSGITIDGKTQFCIGSAETIAADLKAITWVTEFDKDAALNAVTKQDQCYAALSYSLLIIFVSQIIINNTLEVGIPYITTKVKAFIESRSHAKNVAVTAKTGVNAVTDMVDVVINTKDDDDAAEEKEVMAVDLEDPQVRQCLRSPIEYQFYLQQYETPFDDYLELALQFGYVTLFVAAFPLTPLLALLNNLIEVRVDSYKICKLCRRPDLASAQNIGTWQHVFQIMGFAAVISNAAVVLFTADFYDVSAENRVWLFVVFVTVVLLCKMLVDFFIPDVPREVTIQQQRNDFLKRKIFDLERDDKKHSLKEKKRAYSRVSFQHNVMSVDPFISELLKRAAQIFRDNATASAGLDTIFQKGDINKDASISLSKFIEFANESEGLINNFSRYEIEILVNALDLDKDGTISKTEFLHFLGG